MRYYFRVDAGTKIGFGHLIRSISVAKKLLPETPVHFLINNFEKAIELVQNNGFLFTIIPENDEEVFLASFFKKQEPALIIFDNLNLYSTGLVKELKKTHKIVLVHSYSESRYIADLAIYPAAHLTNDFLADPNWSENKTNLLYGPEYILLNESILRYDKNQTIRKSVKDIIFIGGGSDPSGSLLTFFNWCNDFHTEINFSFLYGGACSYIDEIKKIPEHPNKKFLSFDAEYLKNADIAVCAFGVTFYELVYLQVPTLSYGHSPLHASASERFSKKYECSVNLGLITDLTKEVFLQNINRLIDDFNYRIGLFEKSVGLIDGKGIDRVIAETKKLQNNNV